MFDGKILCSVMTPEEFFGASCVYVLVDWISRHAEEQCSQR